MNPDLNRCRWCGSDPLYVSYHDEEWGVPVRDDRTQFEFLILEGAQAGLSWSTILKKRAGYRRNLDGFCNYIWRFVDGIPRQNRWPTHADLPVTTEESDALSKDLKSRGFKFVGSTIMYAHMQATGLVNDHVLSCFRHRECRELNSKGTT